MPLSPRVFDGSIIEAHQASERDSEPIFLPVSLFADDRGWSIMNQLQGVLTPQGQVNFSVQYPGVIKAWHRHKQQTDFWLCLQGHIKAGVYDQERKKVWQMVTGEKNPGVLIVPPPLWHGSSTVGVTSASLFYFVTQAYDPDCPDEERRPFDSVEGFSWAVEHR